MPFNAFRILSLLSAIIFHLLLSGCVGGYLSVQTDYLNEESLASYYVNTPDPRRWCPSIGQRLIISWSLPQKFMCYDDLHIDVALRYHNKETDKKTFPLTRKSGTHLFTVTDEAYCHTGGILTYKIDLVGDGQILDEWRHPIWAEIIELKPLKPQENQPVSDISDWDLDLDSDLDSD